jgi:hypothetical protein
MEIAMSMQEAKQMLQDALTKVPEFEPRDPILIAACSALIHFADWMDQTDARLNRIEEELVALTRDTAP